MGGHVYELLKEKEVPFPLIADSIAEYAGRKFSHCKDMEPEDVTEQINDFIKYFIGSPTCGRIDLRSERNHNKTKSIKVKIKFYCDL